MATKRMKLRAKRIAKQLGYDPSINERIDAAVTEAELTRIMTTARNGKR